MDVSLTGRAEALAQAAEDQKVQSELLNPRIWSEPTATLPSRSLCLVRERAAFPAAGFLQCPLPSCRWTLPHALEADVADTADGEGQHSDREVAAVDEGQHSEREVAAVDEGQHSE